MRGRRLVRGPVDVGTRFAVRLGPWLRFLVRARAYRYLGEAELRAQRRSDTVFIMGSGASLNEITADDWAAISEHDTFGFNWFVHQHFVRCDFHLIRGIPDTDLDSAVWRPQLEEYFRLIRVNPCFAQTVFLVHGGFRAINGNRALGLRLLPSGSAVFRWRSSFRGGALPSRSFRRGLVHGKSTLQECINAAFLLGWRRIVLTGVDLYDRRYFWLESDETRSVDIARLETSASIHSRATSGMVEDLGAWRQWLAGEGCELLVWNPKSLLASALPVFARTEVHDRDQSAL
jgi:hypothetical protein